jgi:hypothetical protein
VFLTRESATLLRTLTLVPAGGMGTYSDYAPAYRGRDACVFNGELIVVERNLPSMLHRFQADGMTENPPAVSLGMVLATGCTSDGTLLYVAVHDSLGSPSQFVVLDKTFTAQPGSPLPMPDVLVTDGLDRCIDLAYSKKGVFYGLFVSSGGAPDNTLSAGQLYPFALDGGVSPPIDAGVLHSIGAFFP